MKVFVLLHDNSYDGYDFHGVYSSKEKAEERIRQLIRAYNYGTFAGDKYFDIREEIIDEELK